MRGRIANLACALAMSILAAGVWGCGKSGSPANAVNQKAPQVNNVVVKALEEIVALREQQYSIAQSKHQAGIVGPTEVEDAQINVSEARFSLASAQNKRDAAADALRAVLAGYEKKLEMTHTRQTSGLATTTEEADARIAVLQTRVRLAQALQGAE